MTDKQMLDYLDSLGNDDFPNFVLGVSRVGRGMYLKSANCKHEAPDVRSAIRRHFEKTKDSNGIHRE